MPPTRRIHRSTFSAWDTSDSANEDTSLFLTMHFAHSRTQNMLCLGQKTLLSELRQDFGAMDLQKQKKKR